MKACGLVHSKRFTVPVTVVGFAMLYMAVEWCAEPGVVGSNKPKPMVDARIRDLIRYLIEGYGCYVRRLYCDGGRESKGRGHSLQRLPRDAADAPVRQNVRPQLLIETDGQVIPIDPPPPQAPVPSLNGGLRQP